MIIVTPRLAGGDMPLPNPLARGVEPSAIDLILDGLALDRPMVQTVGELPVVENPA